MYHTLRFLEEILIKYGLGVLKLTINCITAYSINVNNFNFVILLAYVSIKRNDINNAKQFTTLSLNISKNFVELQNFNRHFVEV